MPAKHQDNRVEAVIHVAAVKARDKMLELVAPVLKPIEIAVPKSLIDEVRIGLGKLVEEAFRFGVGLLVDSGHVVIKAPKARVKVHDGPPPK